MWKDQKVGGDRSQASRMIGLSQTCPARHGTGISRMTAGICWHLQTGWLAEKRTDTQKQAKVRACMARCRSTKVRSCASHTPEQTPTRWSAPLAAPFPRCRPRTGTQDRHAAGDRHLCNLG